MDLPINSMVDLSIVALVYQRVLTNKILELECSLTWKLYEWPAVHWDCGKFLWFFRWICLQVCDVCCVE